jgi:hypothetical protein
MWGLGSLSNIKKENVCAPLEIKARFFIELHFFMFKKIPSRYHVKYLFHH